MLKHVFLALLWLSCSLVEAQHLLISGQIQAIHAQSLGVPELDNWQVKIQWMQEEGKQVKAGDVVVVFETANIASEIEQLESSLRKIKAETKRKLLEQQMLVKEAEIDYEKAKLTLAQAKVDIRIPESQASKYQFARKQIALSEANSNVKDSSEKLTIKKANMDAETRINQLSVLSTEIDLAQKVQQMKNMTLKAKNSGTAMYVEHPWNGNKIQAGDTVRRDFTVLQILATNQLQVRAWLNEVDVAWVTVGQVVELSVDALPNTTFKGKINHISSQASTREKWGKAAYFTMDIEIPQNIAGLLPGMSVLAKVKQRGV